MAAQTFSYNADNSLAKMGSSTVGNDQDGDITCIGGSGCGTFSYDERGNLQQASGIGPFAIDYSYDAFGRRTEVNTGGLASACYVYDGLNPAATTSYCSSSQGVDSMLLGSGLDELFMDTSSGPSGSSSESYLRDALNSTIANTDSSGHILGQLSYDPYGNTTYSGSVSGFEFTGRENDDLSAYYPSFYYMRGRYYYPQLARFISRDPIGLAGGLNLYAYAGDDPVDFSDPTRMDWGWIGGWAGGFFGFAYLVNDTVAGDFGWFGAGAGSGAFQDQPLPLLANENGLDKAVVEYYDGSQNGAGLNDPGLIAITDAIPPDRRLHIYAHLLEEAKKQYPNKAGNPAERHHIFPKYLGFPKSGPVVRLNPAYHQMITNAFRKAWRYGQEHPYQAKAFEIIIDVYSALPVFVP